MAAHSCSCLGNPRDRRRLVVVTVTVLGDRTVQSVKLDPACVNPDDVEMLEDLIVAGVNAALMATILS